MPWQCCGPAGRAGTVPSRPRRDFFGALFTAKPPTRGTRPPAREGEPPGWQRKGGGGGCCCVAPPRRLPTATPSRSPMHQDGTGPAWLRAPFPCAHPHSLSLFLPKNAPSCESIPTSPNSFSMTASRRPPRPARMRLTRDVLPAPRKPTTRVSGILLASATGILCVVRMCRTRGKGKRGGGHTPQSRPCGARAEAGGRVEVGVHATRVPRSEEGGRRGGRGEWDGEEFAVAAGGASPFSRCERR
jgi:hypothetical protein